MRDRLLSECQATIKSNSALMALGGALVCPIAFIDEICRRVNYIKELSDIPGIRSQFAEKLFCVVQNSLEL